MTSPLSIPDSHDRGVSDLLAFTLTFSIIITGIALVTLGGLGAFDAILRGQPDVAETSMIESRRHSGPHLGDAPRRTTSMISGPRALHPLSTRRSVARDR